MMETSFSRNKISVHWSLSRKEGNEDQVVLLKYNQFFSHRAYSWPQFPFAIVCSQHLLIGDSSGCWNFVVVFGFGGFCLIFFVFLSGSL